MKLITLNTWGGRAGKEKLLNFFKKNKKIDIFCLQEIWSAPYNHLEGTNAGGSPIDNSQIMVYGMQEISKTLPGYSSIFHPHHLDNYGLQMLIKKELIIKKKGDLFVYREKGFVPTGDVGFHARNIQYVTLGTKKGDVTIINFHGLWNGKGKADSKDRINQSKKILEFVKSLKNEFILCGDFNLLPNTKSLDILEKEGMKNLIKEFNISSTRTLLYNKPNKHADYIFVSKGIKINEFNVLLDEVSDHSPLFLDFRIF